MKNHLDSQGHRARLRHRFIKSGFKGFNDHEIIELLLTLCIPRRDVKQPAKALLKKFKNIRTLLNAKPEELLTVAGIGEITSTSLHIIKEAANLYLLQSAEKRPILSDSEKLENFWQARLSELRNEVFEVAYLDNRYCLLNEGVERLEEGTIDHTVIYPRKVIESALKRSASAIVLAHNHPSGQANPSDHDNTLTRALVNAAATLNIEVIDHLIICGKEIFSYRRSGFLKTC